MDNHSKKMCVWVVGGIFVLMFQTVVFGTDYFSFGKSVNKSLGLDSQTHTIGLVCTEIFVPVSGTICDIDIALNIEHSSFCDLQIFAGSPNLGGDTILINSYDEYSFDPYRQIPGWMVLNEESMFGIDQSWEPYIGLFKPNGQEKLSSFYGQQSYGMWQIQICDAVYLNTGTVKDIRLDILIDTDVEPVTPFLIPEPATLLLAAIGAAFAIKSRHST